MTTCPTKERIEQFLAERLDRAACEEFADHAEECDLCQATLAELTPSDEPAQFLGVPRAATQADGGAGFQPAEHFLTDFGRLEAYPTTDERDREFFDRLKHSVPTPLWPDVAGYEVLEEIGHGSMGVVYRAREKASGRVVALKMILAGAFATPKLIRRFHTEAETAAELDHPNIVPIYHVGFAGRLPFYTMKYVAGQGLDQLCSTGLVPLQEAAQLVKIVADAVHYAHERGVLHRDLKPANVLLDEVRGSSFGSRGPECSSEPAAPVGARPSTLSLRPLIADFGLAKRLQGEPSASVAGAVIGTPDYMSPEQAAGQSARISTLSDVYSLGAILFDLLTGRAPFHERHGEETTIEEMLRRVREQPAPSPRLVNPAVDRDIEIICLKCLEKDPASRYASARSLAEDLDRYLRGLPIHARPRSAMYRIWQWGRRNPLAAGLIVAIASLFTAITVGGAIATVRIEQQRLALVVFNSLAADLTNDDKWAKPGLHEHRAGILRQALELEPILDFGPKRNPTTQLSVAIVHAKLADSQMKGGRTKEARRHLERARSLMSELIEVGSTIERTKLEAELGNQCKLSAYVEENALEFKAASLYYRDCIEFIQRRLRVARGDEATSLSGQLREAERGARICDLTPRAIDDLDFVFQQEPELQAKLLIHRCKFLSKKGRILEAVETADRLLELDSGEKSRNAYNAACCYAVAARFAHQRKNSRDPASDDANSPERPQTKAVETLRRAVGLGWNRRQDIDWMCQDSDLDFVRDTEGYRELMQQLEGPTSRQ